MEYLFAGLVGALLVVSIIYLTSDMPDNVPFTEWMTILFCLAAFSVFFIVISSAPFEDDVNKIDVEIYRLELHKARILESNKKGK